MKNFPVVTCDAYEGTITRYTSAVTPTGGIAEGAAVYSAPIEKGDFVKLKDNTETGGIILVEASAAGDELFIGMAVSDPFGVDNTTASSGTPAAAYRRKVDVALFGLGIIEATVSATAVVAPGDYVGFDADEVNEVETQIAYASVAVGSNGGLYALHYAAVGTKVAILVGGSVFVGN